VLRIRAAEPDDAMAVAEVHVRSWQLGYRGLLSPDYLDQLRPEDRARQYAFSDISTDGPETIVAVQDGAICGFASTGAASSLMHVTRGELLALYVDPACWRRGIGRRLIDVARRRLTERGYTEAILWMLVGNERAKAFYRTDGWAPDGERRDDQVWGLAVTEARYQRALP
jgi:ribosomal protein S18 acetylase RimI-like enzyme